MVKLLNALNLFDSSGWIVGDLRAKDHGPGWAGAVVAIEPGSYRLRAQGPSNRDFELALAACNGWQTQIFLTCRDTEDSVPTVDLFRSSIFLVPIGPGSIRPAPSCAGSSRCGWAWSTMATRSAGSRWLRG